MKPKKACQLNVITNAHEAIRIANSIKGTTQTVVRQTKKRFKHWSFYVLILSSVGGAIAVIVASVMSIYTLIVSGIILCCTNALGAFLVRKLDRCDDLSSCVDVMATKIRELSLYVKDMQKVNEDLRGVRKDLDANLKEDIRVWEHGYSEINQSAGKIKDLTERLEVTTKKLKVMEDLYANLQNAVNAFSNHVVDLSENSKNIDQKVNSLANKVTGAQVILDTLNDKNNDFDENNDLYRKLNKANVAFLEKFQEELTKIFNLQIDAKEFKETLERQGKALQGVSIEINASLQKIEELNKDQDKSGEDVIKRTEELTIQLNRIVDKLILSKEKQKSSKK